MPDAFYQLPPLDDKDKDNQCIRLVAYKPQVEDVQKYLRKMGYSSRIFNYNHQKYTEDKKQRQILREQLAQKTSKLTSTAQECYQELFTALMHLKILRVFIDGVLRFGIPPTFYIGLVIPKKGEERKIL